MCEGTAAWFHASGKCRTEPYIAQSPTICLKRFLKRLRMRSISSASNCLKKMATFSLKVRPHICQDFPHHVRGDGSLVSRMWEMPDRAVYCPIAFNTFEAFLEAFKDEVDFKREQLPSYNMGNVPPSRNLLQF